MVPLLRLFRFLQGSVGVLVISMILLLASTGLGLIQPRLIEYAIDSGIEIGKVSAIIWSAAGIILTALLAGGLNLASGYMLIKSSQKMGYLMRNALYRKVMSFSFENLDHWRTGELMVRLNSDVNTVRMFVRMGMFIVVQSVIMIVGTVIAMYLRDPELAEKGIFHRVVVVLTGVDKIRFQRIRPVPERGQDRCNLHEIGPSSDRAQEAPRS